MKRIGVAFPGDPANKTVWSGTPSGVLKGLAEIGVEAVPIQVEPSTLVRTIAFNAISTAYLRPRGTVLTSLRAGRAAARVSPALAAVNSSAAPRRLREAGPLDGIVQIGTGYSLPAGTPIVTYEDMTIAQTLKHEYAGWDAISQRGFQARLARQQQSYERAVGCCLATQWAADSVIHDYSIDPAKVHVVGVGRNHTPPHAERDWSEPRFLFVGRDWEGKNGDRVLRVFARLRETHPSARLDVVGGHPPISAAGVTGHGVLALNDPDQHRRLEQLFSEATAFVMPSLAEAAGIAYIEAAAAGIASIGTSAGGPASIIGEAGMVVDPTDDDALLAAMVRLADPATAASLGAAAFARSALFTWNQVASRLLGALEGAPPTRLAA